MGTATRIASLALAVVAAAASLAAQGATSTVDRPQFIKMVAKDYVFDAPQNVQSGIATIHLVNQGTDIHHVLVQELPNGRTIKEFFDATRSAGVPPSWSRTLAQSSAIASGGEAFLSFRMPPGRYILSCLLPAADGRSHIAKGMYQMMTATVTGAPAAAARRP